MLATQLSLNLEELDEADIVRVSRPSPAEAPEPVLALRLGDQAGLVGHDA